MVVISRFRSLWGIEPGPDQAEWRKKFVELKAHGYGKVPVEWKHPSILTSVTSGY